MSTRDRLALAAALATALACSALGPLFTGSSWAVRTLFVVVVVFAVGGVARRVGLPALLVPLAQVVAVGLYACLAFAGSTLAVVVPTGRTLAALNTLLLQGQADVEQLAVPVPPNTGLVLLAVLGAALVAVAVDLLAVGLQRPAVAGLPLLVLLAVPSGLLPGGLGWLPFTLGAAGWLGLLLVEGNERVGRWGVALRSAPTAPTSLIDGEGSTSGRVGRRIGAAALGLAAFVPAVVPGLDARLLPGTGGGGPGDGSSHTTVTYNPITELQGDLTLPSPREVLRYTTDDPTPDYLRMTTLDSFDGSSWRSTSLTPDVRVRDGIPGPAGLQPGITTSTVRTRFQIAGLDAQWLPLPSVPTSVDVKGPWTWNAASETVFATRTSTRRAKTYSATSLQVEPDQTLLESAAVDDRAVREYAAPVPVSPRVATLTQQVVAGATTSYGQAVALQRFFRNPANRFTYNEHTRNPFNNPDALEAFLDAREGFCEQYASAMAAMLRVLDIPSRVAVGFTPGTRDGQSYVVTTSDAHAWPEAWFDGAGWVRFEPTPTDDGRAIVPSYTQERIGGPAPSSDASSGAVPAPSTGAAAAGKGRNLNNLDGVEPALPDPGAAQARSDSPLPPLRLLLLGLAVVLAVAPAAVALLRRRSRWRDAGPLVAWEQLHDDAEDVGHRWRTADSTRTAAARLAAERLLPAAAVEALQRLAAAAERARYARPGGTAEDTAALRSDVRTVRTALRRGAARADRVRAVLAPPSTLRWFGAGVGSRIADGLDRVDDLISGATRRLRPQRGGTGA